jgi:ABC-2 type transport system permease protein
MKKIGVVAAAEFGMLVRTKAFIITVLLMPVLVGGSIVIQTVIAKQVDRTARRFAVVDRTGRVYAPLAQATAARNLLVASGVVPGARFDPEPVVDTGGDPDQLRLALSERVRVGQIFAFAEVPADALAESGAGKLLYYSDRPTYEDLRVFLEAVVNETVRAERLRAAGIDPDVVAELSRKVGSEHHGLFTRGPTGAIVSAPQVDMVTTLVVPLVVMYILFLTIFMTAPQLMNAVMQEKMSRISEVLLGSVTPFELMMGKLLGSAGMAVVLALVYLGGGVVLALRSGYGSVISPGLLLFFLLFMTLAVLLYGSVFIAVGSACNDLKDAQSLITPVMLIAIVPMFAWQAVQKSPSSPFAVAASLFPTASPFLMQLRLALHPGPPWWQVLLAVALTAAATVACVWAAGKIFRIGLLATGKSAGFGQMMRWLKVR